MSGKNFQILEHVYERNLIGVFLNLTLLTGHMTLPVICSKTDINFLKLLIVIIDQIDWQRELSLYFLDITKVLYEGTIGYVARNVGNMSIREVGQVINKTMPFFLKFLMFAALVFN